MSLTVKKVAKLMRGGKPGRHLDGGSSGVRGLYLIVQNRKAAHWELRYQLNGKSRWMGLGSAREFDLGQARERAKEQRRKLSDKTDPLTVRRAERAALALAEAKSKSFKECAEEYIAANKGEWRNEKHGKQWSATLANYAYPIIGNLPVAQIDTGLVLKILEQPIKAERGYPAGTLWTARRETAGRLRGRIESILSFAAVRDYRAKGDNPARWKDHIEAALAKKAKVAVEHHAALPYTELPAFIAELRGRDGVAARALEFTILTAARTGEVIGAQWDEIDLDNAIWTIPAARMKSGEEHRVPLCERAVELLRGAYREANNKYVFIGTQGGAGLSNMSMTSVLKRMGHGGITVHGFRSTFMDWAHERTNYPKVVIDKALAHAVSDKVEAAYRRGDLFTKRRKLMEAWDAYCATPVRASATVTPLHAEGRS